MTTRELLETFTREEGIALYNSKKTDKEIYDILVSKGLTDNYETFISEAQKIFTEKVSKMSKEEILKQLEGAELTEEELQQIAGGKDESSKIGWGITGGLATATVTGAICTYITGSFVAAAGI